MSQNNLARIERQLDELKPWDAKSQALVCTGVIDEAPEVKTYLFQAEGGAWFRYRPGQFVTLELPVGAESIFRTYTISSSPSRPYALSVTVKAQAGSIGTRWMFENLFPGMRLRALGPSGQFTLGPDMSRKLLFISAGSGITPGMSMLRWLADCAPSADVTFINSARRPEEIIFRSELELLATRMPNLKLGFLAEMRSISTPWSGLTGRIDGEKLRLLAPDFLERDIYCCGPEPFMDAVRGMASAGGFDLSRYHQESFAPASIAPKEQETGPAAVEGRQTVRFASSEVEGQCEPGETLLVAARAAGVRIPAACESGLCGTCKVMKISGEVDMNHQGGILDHEIEEGYVLACCSRPAFGGGDRSMTAGPEETGVHETFWRAEDLFLAWVFHLPEGVPVGEAAAREIARLDRQGGAEEDLRFRDLLYQAASVLQARPSRRRVHH